MAEEMASEFRLPIVRVIEGSGGGGSVKTIETTGASNLPGGVGTTRGFHYMTANMAQVPVVALGLGSVAGLGAARLVASHYSIMTKIIGDVRGRAAGGERGSAKTSTSRNWAAGRSRPAAARSTTRSIPRRRRWPARAAFSPTCRPRSTPCRRRRRATTIQSAPTRC